MSDMFYSCRSLTNLDVSGFDTGSVTNMSGIFSACSGLESLDVSGCDTGMVTDMRDMFWCCSGLKRLDLSGFDTGMVTDMNRMFFGCESLTNLDVSGFDCLSASSDYAFRNCTALTDITLPSSLPVINNSLFYGCSSLTGIVIPDSVTSIAENAFEKCQNVIFLCSAGSYAEQYAQENGIAYQIISQPQFVESGTLGDDLAYAIDTDNQLTVTGDGEIPEDAFSDREDIQEVVLAEGVTRIGASAFQGCSALTSVTLPDSLTELGAAAFADCDALAELLVSDQNPSLSTNQAVLYNNAGTTLLVYPAGKTEESFIIPEGVTGIEDYAFAGCDNLKTITFPNAPEAPSRKAAAPRKAASGGVQRIGSYAFYTCTGLTGMILPDTLETIGAYAFAGCIKLTGLVLPGSLTAIREGLLADCGSLTGIIIPDGVTSIAANAFRLCGSLTEVTIPDSVTGIDADAFTPSENLIFLCNPGSFAAQYAQAHGISTGNAAEESTPVCDGGASCPGKAFKDLPAAGTWQHEGIDYCVVHNIMNGMSTTEFEPNGNLTRGQLVTVLYRVAGRPSVTFTKVFPDVAAGRYYSEPIIWAAQNGIVNGFDDGTFQPDTPITREQLATILYRYDGSPAVSGDLRTFPDYADVHNYGKTPLLWATENKLLPGVTEEFAERLAPRTNATRAQIASFIMRYLESK